MAHQQIWLALVCLGRNAPYGMHASFPSVGRTACVDLKWNLWEEIFNQAFICSSIMSQQILNYLLEARLIKFFTIQSSRNVEMSTVRPFFRNWVLSTKWFHANLHALLEVAFFFKQSTIYLFSSLLWNSSCKIIERGSCKQQLGSRHN